MIKIKNLNFTYYSRNCILPILDNINLEIKSNESFGLMGQSGSGKSTLLNILMGLLPNWTGEIYIDNSAFKRPNKDFYKKIQLVFQDPYSSLHPRKSINQILREPLLIYNVKNKKAKIIDVLQAVGLDYNFLTRYPHQLSGGQRQRVSIARSLLLNCKIILLDEPTSALDSLAQFDILNLLLKIKAQRNLTYLFVSHNPTILSYLCDRIAILKDKTITNIFNKQEFIKSRITI